VEANGFAEAEHDQFTQIDPEHLNEGTTTPNGLRTLSARH
jgi:hypothetical protein